MLAVHFWNFSKKQNSTVRPSADPVVINCALKEDSGVTAPVLEINAAGLYGYNYCYIPEFSRYYYVTEWTYEKHAVWTCTLVCDILATFRTQIGAATLYALRTSAAYDGDIVDTLYPAKSESQFAKVTATNPWLSNIQSGTFVVGVSSGEAPTYGTTTYYAVDSANLIGLMRGLNRDFVTAANGFSLNDASFELQKGLINPFSYINACIWYPIDFGDMPTAGTLHQINVGGVDMPANGLYISASSPLKTYVLTFAPPSHPQAAARGRYMNEAYRTLFLELPPFGTAELDPSICCMYPYVVCEIELDATTGVATISIGASDTQGSIDTLITKYDTQLGVPMQLSARYRDIVTGIMQAGGGIGNTIANIVAGNYAGAIASAGAGIGNSVQALKPHVEKLGTQGSFAAYAGSCTLYAQFVILPDEDNGHLGRPLCQNRQISTIPGYIKVADGDIDIPGYAEEAGYIKQQLEAGFFYE